MTGRAIKIDKRLPCFIGGRVGDIKSDRSLIPSLTGLRAPRLSAGCRIYFMKTMCDTRSARPALQGLEPEHGDDPLLFSLHFFDKRCSIDDLDAVVVLEVSKVRVS